MRGFVAVVVVVLSSCSTTPRACTKMKSLCDTSVETCVALRENTKKSFGDEALDALDGCLLSSSSCSEAAGCTTAAATKGALDAMKRFGDGFEKEMKR